MLKRIPPGLAAAADQAWLSLLSLALAFAFIRYGDKQAYGHYVMLLTPIILAQGALNALVLSPLATLLPACAEPERAGLRDTARLAALGQVLGMSLLAGAGLWLAGGLALDWVGPGLALAFALAMAGTLLRDLARASAYAEGRVGRALAGDLLFGLVLLAGLLWLIASGRLGVAGVLLVSAAAGLVPLALGAREAAVGAAGRDSWRRFWVLGRWALPGVLVTWVNLSAYPLVAGIALGVGAAAEIAAGRLFMVPVALGVTAWSNLYRPRFSRLFGAGDLAGMRRLSVRSVRFGVLAVAAYAALVWALFPLLQPLLGPSYQGLGAVVLAWAVYFALAVVRTVFSASLMVEEGGYRQLHHMGWAAMCLCLGGLAALAGFGTAWIVGVLCAVELFQLAWTWRAAARCWRGGACP